MDEFLVSTSKFLSYVLRHNPEAIGLTLEPGGWADVAELVARSREDGRRLSRRRIQLLLDAGEKSRFSLSADGTKIRANYGHSIDVDLNLEPTRPPKRLYHGTARRAVSSIRDEGLRPRSRQYVHLSRTREAATSVGQRHGRPIVLTVHAESLSEDGYALCESTDSVWLVRRVPPEYLEFPEHALK